jgi:hypothetical protein
MKPPSIRRLGAGLLTFACALLPRFAAAQQGDQPAQPLKVPAREERILQLKATAAEAGDADFETLDCYPDSPFLLCMEKSKNYNAQLMLEAFRECVDHLYKLFKGRFGELYNAKTFEREQVCLVYVFETRVRYAEFTKAAAWSGGEFDSARGALFIYKDTNQLYETLFREGARQLLAGIAAMKDENSGGKGDTTMAWLSMGIGTWLECFKRDASGGFVLGKRAVHLMPYVVKLASDGKLRKVDEFLKLTSAGFEKEAQDPKQRQSLSAQAWAFWYFMQTAKDGAHLKELDAYFKKEMEQKGGYDAAKECFGDLEALNTEYVEFLKAQK